MLTGLSVQNLVVVREVDLEFAAGLSVITGETGAGKSILIEALGLALGERAESRLIRPGAERAVVSARFNIADVPAARALIGEQALDDEDECILRRVITRDGRSRAWCNQSPVPLATLRELAAVLVDIHAQHAGQRLLKRDHQRDLLDDFATTGELRQTVADACAAWQRAGAELAACENAGADAARVDLMRYQVQELQEARLDENELATIEQEYRKHANAQTWLEHCAAIRAAVSDPEGGARQALDAAAGHARALGKQAAEAANLIAALDQADIAVAEALDELDRIETDLDLDPRRVEQLDRRLGELHNLARKHHTTLEDLHGLMRQLEAELAQFDQRDEQLENLREVVRACHNAYVKAAGVLSAARKTGAGRLEKTVTTRLRELGMPYAGFSVHVEATNDGTPQPHGLDRIEFRVSTNPDTPAGPLGKVASGGELSRITLAIQAATAEHHGIPVAVYDEVDTGIGGNTANIVGANLRDVARHAQVICITHSPQVASAGDHHLLVDKQIVDGHAETILRTLDEKAREHEIARMLGATKKSRSSLAHARELLAQARA